MYAATSATAEPPSTSTRTRSITFSRLLPAWPKEYSRSVINYKLLLCGNRALERGLRQELTKADKNVTDNVNIKNVQDTLQLPLYRP